MFALNDDFLEIPMLTRPDGPSHPFDAATRVTAGDSRWTGHTSADYWAFVGPFGGITAATMLRALMEHPERLGDPLAVTVNFCAPIAQGPFDLDVRLIKANRSTQHWSVELTQNGADAAAFATAVFAVRRESWSHRPAQPPQATPFDQTRPLPKSTFKMSWVHQFDFRFIDGAPAMSGAPNAAPDRARSTLWIGDSTPRRIDGPSLLAMSDAFFARIFHVRGELVPFGTVSMTTYFHTAMADLEAARDTHVLAVADAHVFNKSYADQTGALWSPDGQLLATTQQIAYFKV